MSAKKFIFVMLAFIPFFMGTILAFFGLSYFFLVDSKKWMDILLSIVIEKRWILATLMTIGGLFLGVVPLTIAINYGDKK